MRRPLLLTIAAVTAIIPALTFAAFEKPSDVLRLLMTTVRPMDFSYEVHGEMPEENMYATLWMKGTGKNNILKPLEADSDTRFTLDIMAPKTKVRVKFQVRTTGGKTYAHLDELRGNYDDELINAAAQLSSPKWFVIPNDDLNDIPDQSDVQAMFASFLDNAFTVTKRGADTYVLTLKPGFIDEIANGMGNGMSIAGNDVPEFLRGAKAEINVQTAGNELRTVGVNFSFMDTTTRASVTVKGSASVRWTPFSVTAPPDARDLEEMFNSWTPDFPSFPSMDTVDMPPSVEHWTPETTDWNDTTDTPSWTPDEPSAWTGDCSSGTAAERLLALRRGDCGTRTASPRRANRQLRSITPSN